MKNNKSKNTIKKLKKKPLFFLLGLLAVCAVGGTIAYFTSEARFTNEFKAKTYNVQIEEEFENKWGTKKVSFVNKESTNTAVVLRINYNESWTKILDGVTLTLDNNVNGENVVTKAWTAAFDDFQKGSDGWYYYKKTLGPGKSVQVLDSITLNENLIKTSPYYEDYKTYTYELDFNFEAIQATAEAVKEIWGKTATISGGNVTWGS